MYSLYQEYSNESVTLTYLGVFSNQITRMLVDLSENFLSKKRDLGKGITHKASFLLIESFQNVIKHGLLEYKPDYELQYNKEFFQIKILVDRIIFSSANVIKEEQAKNLNDKISQINALDKEDLRNLRNEILANGELLEKGGAGIGLIEMVIKTGLPLLYKIKKLKTGFSLLFLSIELPIDTKPIDHILSISEIENKYEKFIENDYIMVYKGDFSSDSNLKIISMLEHNFIEGGKMNSQNTKNILTIIELMQNISKHGKSINGYKGGIFALSKKNSNLFIECNNFVEDYKYEKLKEYLEKIKKYNKAQLDEVYKNKLKIAHLAEDGNVGLGLLEIARFSNNNFSYNFVETESKEIYFSMRVKTI